MSIATEAEALMKDSREIIERVLGELRRAERDVGDRQAALERELRDMATDAKLEADRVAAGGMPSHHASSFASSAAKVAVAQTELAEARNRRTMLAWVAGRESI